MKYPLEPMVSNDNRGQPSLRKRLRDNLVFSMLLIVFWTTLLTIGIFSWILRDFIVRGQRTNTDQTLLRNASTIENVLQHPFMTNDKDMVQTILFDLGVQREANSIRVITNGGVVYASSIPNEVGIQLSPDEAQCQTCHGLNSAQLPHLQPHSNAKMHRGPLFVAEPLENRIACQSCHAVEDQTLGILLVEFPLSAEENWNNLLNFGLASGTLFLSLLLTLIFHRHFTTMVIHPLRKLLPPTRVREGEMGNEIERIVEQMSSLQKGVLDSETKLAEQHK